MALRNDTSSDSGEGGDTLPPPSPPSKDFTTVDELAKIHEAQAFEIAKTLDQSGNPFLLYANQILKIGLY
ncbi:hypothetical protein REPUB_Repub19eG0034000 [Reevesia pubescens]